MIKVAFAIYRQWGYDIFQNIKTYQEQHPYFQLDILILSNNHQANLVTSNTYQTYHINPSDSQKLFSICKQRNIDIICFYSWSFVVDKVLLDNFICLCLHPSKLPQYRGGTPIQHQIMNNEKHSAVTIFRMSEDIDAGDIYAQTTMSLEGDINDIFSRMVRIGTNLTKQLLLDAHSKKLTFYKQKNPENYPPSKRRIQKQSQIFLENAKNMSYQDINNLVRGLLDPYPNAYIQRNDFHIKIKKIAYVSKILPDTLQILPNTCWKELKNAKSLLIPLKRGFAKIVTYSLENATSEEIHQV